MVVEWTPKQEEAIKTTDRGVVVPAAAGSGKTAVLIERVVRLLADKNAGCPSENLLAVTFTKDAANQMRTKLSAALSARVVSESDPETREWLARQQDMLSLAKISTINSFCLDLVKENLNEFDYRSGIKIVDDTQAQVILDEAMEQTFEELRAENPDMIEELVDALTNNSDVELANQVHKMFKFLCSLPFPDNWISEAGSRLTDSEAIEGYVRTVTQEYCSMLDKAEKYNENARYTAAGLKNGAGVLDVLASDLAIIEDLRAAIKNASYTQIYETVGSVKYNIMRKPSDKKLKDADIADNERIFTLVKAIREREKKLINAISSDMRTMGEDIYEPMKYSARIFESLCEVYRRLCKNMHERKVERGVAEFADVERMAMELLVRMEDGKICRTELANRIAESHTYRVLLIDEFQDVNNLQEMIFRALSDSDDLGTLGKNVFVVGDVKQSIYRFRLSNPALFLNAVNDAENCTDNGLCKIRLATNFRSRQNVVNYVNRVFSTIMSKTVGGLDYTDDEKLVYGASFGGDDSPVDLLLISDHDKAEQFKYVNYGSEELCIAARIKKQLDSHKQVWDVSAEKFRDSRPSDYCVLSRNKDGCRRVAAALESVGLKAQSEQTDGYMGSKEIVTMVSLLQVIDTPMKDLPMAAVMASPILGFTADEIAKLRMLCLRDPKKRKSLWQILLAVSKTDTADEKEAKKIKLDDPALENKCRCAAELIRRLRFYSVSMSLEALISRIYDETDFFAVASVFENSKQKRANLRLLSQRAAEYEKDSSGGIAGFLRYLESVTASGGDFSQAVTVTGGNDSVAVKTIHSSKGLEYPFVYLCSLDKSFNLKDMSAQILLSEKSGFGLEYMSHDKLMNVKTIAHRAMEIDTKKELLSEEMRLLYVALTRAKEQLTIPFFMRISSKANIDVKKRLQYVVERILSAGGVNPSALCDFGSYLEWLAAEILVSDKNVPLLRALEMEDLAMTLSNFGISGQSGKPNLEWWEYPDEIKADAEKTEFSAPLPNEKKADELCRKYEFAYPNDAAFSAAKRTVTEIVSELHQRENGEADPMFYPQLGSLGKEAERLSAAQRGTYTHLFMELADYENAERGVKNELERLVEQGLFTEREAKGVYTDAVAKYFSGNFYKRVKRSDDVRREIQFMVRADDAGIAEKYAEFIAPNGMLQGICDCIFREDDGYVLVDYKTDNFSDISELEKYSVQLELYKAALDQILPLPVKACYIYSFRLSEGKEIKL